jgi:hypothetical protein
MKEANRDGPKIKNRRRIWTPSPDASLTERAGAEIRNTHHLIRPFFIAFTVTFIVSCFMVYDKRFLLFGSPLNVRSEAKLGEGIAKMTAGAYVRDGD